MKLATYITLLAVLVTTVLAWTKEDHEIFDLVSALETAEGKGTTFYSWLDVHSTATTSEIAKAYRKMSMLLHPDKNPNVPGIQERFSRLGVISTILRNKESRERYDFFYKNGVPKWRGTGYYYSRFRPGLGSVLAFLILLTSALQYVVQRMNYTRDLARIEQLVGEARSAAWGPKLVPLEGKRKVKVKLGGPQRMDDDGNVSSGRVLDMVVDGQEVYILDPSGEIHPLDESAAAKPTITQTWFFALIGSLLRRLGNRKVTTEAPATNGGTVSELDDGEESFSSDSEVVGGGTKKNGEPKGPRVSAAKAGGMRRKAVRKR